MAHAMVVGAGVGGLAAALGLARRGWTVAVLERAAALAPVGSGLALAPNALSALAALGLGDAVRAHAQIQGRVGFRRPNGRPIVVADASAVAASETGDTAVVVHRAALVGLLADALPAGVLELGVEVLGVEAGAGTVRTAAGSRPADLVVAADGIHSPVRRALFADHPAPAYAGVTAWRLVAPRPPGELVVGETWGRGQVVGLAPVTGPDGADLVYLYATDRVPAGGATGDPAAELTTLRRLFGGWADPIPAVLAAAAGAVRTDVYALPRPPAALHAGRVALLGDAAHAMTPNLGQGACQALEDAVVLAHRADPGGTVDLAGYTAVRRPRVADVQRRSASICRLTRLRHPVAVALRDAGMTTAARLLPDLMTRSMAPVLGWRAPDPVG